MIFGRPRSYWASRRHHDDELHACFESRWPRCSKSSRPATENLKTRCRLGDRLRANSGIDRHTGGNCQKTWLDFHVTSKRYNSTNSFQLASERLGFQELSRDIKIARTSICGGRHNPLTPAYT